MGDMKADMGGGAAVAMAFLAAVRLNRFVQAKSIFFLALSGIVLDQ